MLPVWIAVLAASQEVNVYQLDIGPNRSFMAKSGFTSMSDGTSATAASIAQAADGYTYLLFGEQHDNQNHKEAVAQIIQALVDRGRIVSVGLEMFTRPNQGNLYNWSLGKWDESTFIEQSNWKNQWGFDYSIYRPMFEAVKQNRLPLVALNIPREWVRTVSRNGPESLPAEAREQVPPIDTNNKDHQAVFGALMGGHPPSEGMKNIYAAQVLWDVAMADSALKAMNRWPHNPKRIMVILAGSGHVMYGQGINYRLHQQAGVNSLSVIGVDSSQSVRSGIGDFTYVGG